ncbi:MAG: class I SAM-dependent methyltransferase [Candidatus Omnitrophica bacterium]|nr:class I SAM-dependent methyltransferase [Candidatus Omnitrophota bacterium]
MISVLKNMLSQNKRLQEIHKIEGHFGLNEGRLLCKLTKLLKDDSVIVEIGAFKGKSTCFIAEGIGNKDIRFYTIDTWYNDQMPQGRGDVYDDFLKNIRGYRDKIEPLRGYSYEVVQNWPKERKIDFLWIDGDHSYEGVSQDIADWFPLLKKGSIVAFHDYRDAPGVKKAVDDLVVQGRLKKMTTEGCIFAGKYL